MRESRASGRPTQGRDGFPSRPEKSAARSTGSVEDSRLSSAILPPIRKGTFAKGWRMHRADGAERPSLPHFTKPGSILHHSKGDTQGAHRSLPHTPSVPYKPLAAHHKSSGIPLGNRSLRKSPANPLLPTQGFPRQAYAAQPPSSPSASITSAAAPHPSRTPREHIVPSAQAPAKARKDGIRSAAPAPQGMPESSRRNTIPAIRIPCVKSSSLIT